MTDEKKQELGDLLAPNSEFHSRLRRSNNREEFRDIESWISALAISQSVDEREALKEFRASKSALSKIMRGLFASDYPLISAAKLKQAQIVEEVEAAMSRGMVGDAAFAEAHCKLAQKGVHYDVGSVKSLFYRVVKSRDASAE